MFLVNSCLGLVTAATLLWHPFSLTYGVNLPSSLTTLLPIILGFSPRLPVSVYGTGTFILDSGFSRQCGINCFGTLNFPPHQAFGLLCGFTYTTPTSLGPAIPAAGSVYPTASPHLSDRYRWYRNINLLSITYAFRPRLRSRLTLGGRTFPRNP